MPYTKQSDKNAAQSRFQSTEKGRDYLRRYRQTEKYKNTNRIGARRRHTKMRVRCLSHYSNGNPKCSCCGEDKYEFLCIDHINGGGNKHRKEWRKNHGSLCHFLVSNGFPDGFRVLCHNCNLAIGFYGKCPHTSME